MAVDYFYSRQANLEYTEAQPESWSQSEREHLPSWQV